MALAHDQLRRLLVAVEAGQPIPAEVAGWFVEGAESFLKGRGSLCRCLELRAPGQRSAATVQAQEQRNRHLREAARLVAAGPEVSAWERAQRLAELVRRFESTTWPRLRSLSAPPDHLPPIKAALFHAFRAGAPVPASARRLYAIVVN